MSPIVSCIIPTFNSGSYLDEAIESILNQTWRPLEIIIADDSSTDNTREIALSYSASISFYSQPTSGPAATRNLGLSHAQGEFIAFLDADDLWHPEKLTRQMTAFCNDAELSLCITYVERFWSESLNCEKIYFANHSRSQPIPGYATPSLLAKRTAFELIGNFDTNLWFTDATEWFIRARVAGLKLAIVTDVLTYHRMHQKNLTRRHSLESKQEFLKIVKTNLDNQRKI
ncbi:glycosyltransferase family A protein [Thermosynechococcaceae cyanobacterium BACA0444]|uniref:Glycosyltransferase family A protein n=1 Tax=Pseudocalidococcus azoricus BACA0444 TaxID=2918990 RepID=A0AAE4JXH3_9CYAN|nr:glycosyltransferase family A protein [Pseudocalidococcus azoricus]MDS3862226.1 glycosyltransferase family A protein [Pseudocalidococcus azoricus BACA0444]